MAATVKPALSIAELEAMLAGARQAQSDAITGVAQDTLAPFIENVLTRKPVKASAKEGVKWIGTADSVKVTVDGREYRVSLTITDTEATNALKAGK